MPVVIKKVRDSELYPRTVISIDDGAINACMPRLKGVEDT